MVCISSPCGVHWPKRTSPVPKLTRMTSKGEKSRGMLLSKWSWHLALTTHPSLVLTRWRRRGRYLLPALDAENRREPPCKEAREPAGVSAGILGFPKCCPECPSHTLPHPFSLVILSKPFSALSKRSHLP